MASAQGTCKSFNPAKGFGFVTGLDGKDHFFHKKDITGKLPKTGDTLMFVIAQSDVKPGQTAATNVTGGTLGGDLQGTCKWYNESKGFGFIDYNGQSYFMHHGKITGGMPKEGDKLFFDLAPSEKDPTKQECINVVGGTGYPIEQGGWGGMASMMSMMWGPYGKGKGKGKWGW
eukprot:TRINITY_DN109727_c0_g1_i1.p1 TRINITY_DN109727_c0_g1~~TRINITY_DN109727_c0_g1_i1.p1  ORF type:complete len:173 (+),score=42.53 TRINITY_DN109727_c0_g1_i1:75-593(+)